jgi:hypothetical protein
MGYNQRNDGIRDNIERMRREREAYSTRGLRPRSPHGFGPPLLLRSLQDITG